MNEILREQVEPDMRRPVGRPPKSGVQVRAFDMRYQARLKMGVLAYNLLQLMRERYMRGERRSVEWVIRRLIKVAARVTYHGRRWWVRVASAFPLAHHYRAVLGSG